jgi:hypothetical protein
MTITADEPMPVSQDALSRMYVPANTLEWARLLAGTCIADPSYVATRCAMRDAR